MSKFKTILNEPKDELLIRDDYVTKENKKIIKALLSEPEDAKLVNQFAQVIKSPESRLTLKLVIEEMNSHKEVVFDGVKLAKTVNIKLKEAGVVFDKSIPLEERTKDFLEASEGKSYRKKFQQDISMADVPLVMFEDNPELIEECMNLSYEKILEMSNEDIEKYLTFLGAYVNIFYKRETKISYAVAELEAEYQKIYDSTFVAVQEELVKKGWSKQITHIKAVTRNKLNQAGIGEQLAVLKLTLKTAKGLTTEYKHIWNALWRIWEMRTKEIK